MRVVRNGLFFIDLSDHILKCVEISYIHFEVDDIPLLVDELVGGVLVHIQISFHSLLLVVREIVVHYVVAYEVVFLDDASPPKYCAPSGRTEGKR